jgi:hypothetical protein
MRTWRGRWVGWVNWGTQIADKAGYIWIYLELEYSLIEASNFLVMVPKLGRIGDFNRTDSASHSSG